MERQAGTCSKRGSGGYEQASKTAGLPRRTAPLTPRILLEYTWTVAGEPDLTGLTGFDWDEGNLLKNWEKHRVSDPECEQVFFNRPLVVRDDERHSGRETRLYGLGQTDAGRRLFVVFTVRGATIRVISARDMNRRENREYDSR